MTRTTNAASRVTSISMKRVHNLGNYENIQYEVTVEVGEKDDPGKVLTTLERILEDVRAKSGVEGYQLRRAQEVVEKPHKDRTDTEKQNLKSYKEMLRRHSDAMKRREKAIAALATLNYTSTHNDAKQNWDDEDYLDE